MTQTTVKDAKFNAFR